ncbi:MAG: DUF481 domain-containing protein [Woeseiaceae bacterium]
MKIIVFISLNLILLLPITSKAIVNMEGLHFEKESHRFTADMDITVSGTSGNSVSSKVAVNTQFNWKAPESINMALFGYQYGENKNVRNINKYFLHYRHIHKFKGRIDWEIFTQYEENEFVRLSYRGLVGAGFRYHALNHESDNAYLGFGIFQSKEKIKEISGLTDDGVEELTRGNFYLMSKHKLTSSINYSNVLYYQPNLNEMADFRALFSAKLDFLIKDGVKFRLSLDVEHDSQPSLTVKETDVSYMSGLLLSF